MFKKLIRTIIDPNYRWKVMVSRNLLKWIPDKYYIKRTFRVMNGKKLDLKDPKTFNEKLQWLKLYNRNPRQTMMVDKYEVKQFISELIGEQYVIPTLGVWNSFKEIDFQKLPEQFVLKCTHDSGSVVLCSDKKKFVVKQAEVKLTKALKRNFYYLWREWPYKKVKHRIIAEPLITDDNCDELRDYKFFCFDGKVKCFKVDFDRFTEHHANYYNPRGELLPFGELDFPPTPTADIKIPDNLGKMIELAEKLAKDIPFVRVDFYDANGKILFGELTFYPAAGMEKFTSDDWQYKLGSWINLPMKQKY